MVLEVVKLTVPKAMNTRQRIHTSTMTENGISLVASVIPVELSNPVNERRRTPPMSKKFAPRRLSQEYEIRFNWNTLSWVIVKL